MQTNIGCNKEFAGIRPPGMTIQIDKTLTKPGYAADAAAAGLIVKQAKDALSHYPIIGANGNWYIWDINLDQYVDSERTATLMTVIVRELPSSGKPGVIYLVPYAEGENRYKEYIWISDEELEEAGCGCNHACASCPHHCPCPCPYPATGRFEPLGYECDLELYATMQWVEENFISKDDEDLGNLVLVEYGVSSYNDVSSADEEGKLVACIVDGKTFTLSSLDESGATFATTYLQFEEGEPHVYSQILYVYNGDVWTSSDRIELASAIKVEQLSQDLEEIKQQIGQVNLEELEHRVDVLEAKVDYLQPIVQETAQTVEQMQPLVQQHQDLYDALNPHVDEITQQYNVDFDVIDGNGSW